MSTEVRQGGQSWLYAVPDLATAQSVLRQFAAFPPVGPVSFTIHRLRDGSSEQWYVGASGDGLTPADRTLIPRVLGRRGRRADHALMAVVQSQAKLVSTIRTRGVLRSG